MSKKNACLIMAAGVGARASTSKPKQYEKLFGTALINYSIAVLKKHNNINNLVVIINKSHEDFFKNITQHLGDIEYVFGGETRQESVRNGLEYLSDKNIEKILIHDAARPFICDEIIDRVLNGVTKDNGAIAAIKINDTVKKVQDNDNQIIESTQDRAKLYVAQTPQGFVFDDIFQLHKKYENESFTDDASLFEHANKQVKIVEGGRNNFKITTQEDFKLAEQIMLSNSNNFTVKTGLGYDVHQLIDNNDDRYLILGGVKIKHNKILKGHSDADVLIHAIVDAIFGAIAEGDIGDHFPPSNPKFKNADSKIFLQYAAELVKKHKSIINNIDATIICEQPKLSPFKLKIKENIANICNIDKSNVNIKATTTEKLGFTGRDEGIAAQAIVTIKQYLV